LDAGDDRFYKSFTKKKLDKKQKLRVYLYYIRLVINLTKPILTYSKKTTAAPYRTTQPLFFLG
jgi:hypothetical protein